MANLFTKYLCPIIVVCLQSLTKDWVQWLKKCVCVIEWADASRNHQLQSFQRVIFCCSEVYIKRKHTGLVNSCLQGCFGNHAFDREGNFRQIETSWQNFFPDLFQYLFCNIPNFFDQFFVGVNLSSIFVTIFVPNIRVWLAEFIFLYVFYNLLLIRRQVSFVEFAEIRYAHFFCDLNGFLFWVESLFFQLVFVNFFVVWVLISILFGFTLFFSLLCLLLRIFSLILFHLFRLIIILVLF